MQDHKNADMLEPKRVPWNKGKMIGTKPSLRSKHVWSIRSKLQIEGRIRDLAMFNLAIDSKFRGCDVVALKVEDVAPYGYAVDRATVRQHHDEAICTACFSMDCKHWPRPTPLRYQFPTTDQGHPDLPAHR